MRTRMTLITIILLAIVMVLLVVGSTVAGPPAQGPDVASDITLAGTVASKISYQGRLTDAGGNPLDGNYNLVFQLWDDATAGSQLGSDIVKNNVPVSDGLFTVELDVPQDAFNGQGLWLQVSVSGQTLSPRQELLPVPYALSLKPGAHVQGDTSDTTFSATNTGSGDGVQGSTSNPSGHGVYGEATNSGDARNYGGFFVAEGTRGRGVYGKAANAADEINYGGFFYASGVQGRGVFGQAEGSSGIGVKGWASDEGDVQNYGGHFTASGWSGIGVYGRAESIFGGESYGGWFETESHYGKAVYGKNNGNGNYGYIGGRTEGVYGQGMWYGVQGESGGSGVYGKNTQTGDVGMLGGEGWGFRGNAEGSGTGIYGYAPDAYGTGLVGWATGDNGTGVYARGGSNGYAADFEGDARIQGALEVQGALTVDGPATGFFPRPAYDSGWRSINQGEGVTLNHGLGGSPNDYVVDLRCWDAPGALGIHNTGVGYDFNGGKWGVRWHSLYDTSIDVQRADDDELCGFIQVRIWVYK